MSSAYHPESDGSTERANKTVNQMLRHCIEPLQKDWAQKLPAIEFAINSARSESTGFAPFFLNSGRMPRSFIWDSNEPEKYPGVRVFAQRMKTAVMRAHDSIIAARVKQVRTANRKRQRAPFALGDLAYVSTKNMAIPAGLARKLSPKFIGPYLITEDFKNNSFRLKLPPRLKQRGLHDVFHASLLRIHVPNDDRLFPGRLDTQIFDDENLETEWTVERIVSHAGTGKNSVFEVLWKSGDKTWLPYDRLTHLDALRAYFDVMGVQNIEELSEGTGNPPDDDLQIFLGCLGLNFEEEYEAIKLAEHETVRSSFDRAKLGPSHSHERQQHRVDYQEASRFVLRPPHSAPGSHLEHDLDLPCRNHIYVADKDGQTFSVTVNMARDFMSFHTMVAQTNSKTPSKERLERLNSICEPFGYRHFARLVNADPLIKDELVEITEGSAIKYPTYRDGYRPHFLRFDGEKQSEIDNALEIAALFSGSKDKAQEAIDLAFRVATTTFGGSKVAKTTNKGKGKPYEKKNRRNVKDRDGDVNMG
ncbi:hypothetical protein NLJ89_g7527 [Agrocybe chaxingu]|uniref:Tf2-1-like SH3-like domain-containing protein n=1 Tax=Agrocybe chaxingu TaxID=84603 RepID=A0A9W8JW72_9AGAR|nr:hypothetical protein NLJ89_g7527 [Agrocybe chaxingu]